ncbi:Uncharacterised protein [Vibrio cholerae]|nr:Uncharacterised protein [Vibrio cholerae]
MPLFHFAAVFGADDVALCTLLGGGCHVLSDMVPENDRLFTSDSGRIQSRFFDLIEQGFHTTFPVLGYQSTVPA